MQLPFLIFAFRLNEGDELRWIDEKEILLIDFGIKIKSSILILPFGMEADKRSRNGESIGGSIYDKACKRIKEDDSEKIIFLSFK